MGVVDTLFHSTSPDVDDVAAGAIEGVSRSGAWQRIRITRIEDLHDAVLGAGLDAMQLSTAPIDGSLVFAERDGMQFSSGLINGHVALQGPLSQSFVTLGVALSMPRSARHWLQEV